MPTGERILPVLFPETDSEMPVSVLFVFLEGVNGGMLGQSHLMFDFYMHFLLELCYGVCCDMPKSLCGDLRENHGFISI